MMSLWLYGIGNRCVSRHEFSQSIDNGGRTIWKRFETLSADHHVLNTSTQAGVCEKWMVLPPSCDISLTTACYSVSDSSYEKAVGLAGRGSAPSTPVLGQRPEPGASRFTVSHDVTKSVTVSLRHSVTVGHCAVGSEHCPPTQS